MYKKKKVLVIIPARSGSKGIKNKNIRLVKKRPLLYYSIRYAKKCKLVDKIIVSTDSKKYANIVKKLNVEVPFLRSKKLSGDKIQDYPVVKNCLNMSEKYFKDKFDYIVLLRPTSPFREKQLIEKGLKKIHKVKFSTSVRSVIKTKNHPYRHWKINNRGKLVSIFPKLKEPYNIPRQQLTKMFFQTGDIEIIKRETIFNKSISGTYVIPLIVRSYKDIDEIEDLKTIK